MKYLKSINLYDKLSQSQIFLEVTTQDNLFYMKRGLKRYKICSNINILKVI